MPFAENSGVKLYYEVAGDGPAILFLHEYAGDHRAWPAQVECFSRTHTCITTSARGYPPSDVPLEQGAYSQDLAEADALAVLDALGVDKAHMFGISMGAYTAVQLARKAPDRCLSAIALAGGSGSHPPTREKFIADCHKLAGQMESAGAIPATAMGKGPTRIQLFNKNRAAWDLSVEHLAEHDAGAAARTLRGVQAGRPSLADLTAELAAIQTPILFGIGDEDESSLDVNLYLKRTIPSAQLVILPGSGHAVTLEEPDLVNQFAGQFISSVEDGSWRPRDPGAIPGETASSIGIGNE